MKQKKARSFRGLQAQERPIILPGGRKWRNAKDAMNEEMIAEIISSQAELIMGSTLGYASINNLIMPSFTFCHSFVHIFIILYSSEYESPFLKFDER